MKNDRKTIILIEVCLGILLAFTIGWIIFQNYHDHPEKIRIILPDVENSKWAGVKYGAKMAAQDMGMEVIFEDQQYAKDGEKLPLPALDSEEMGKTLAQAILMQYEKRITGKKIGVIYSHSEDFELVSGIKAGFDGVMKDAKAEIIWEQELEDAFGEKDKIKEASKVDLMIALDNDSLIAAAQLSSSGELHGAIVNGIGQCTEAVYYLDKRIIQCLIVPDTFMIGYQGYMLELNPDYKKEQIGYTLLTRDNLFDQENQTLIYTLSQ